MYNSLFDVLRRAQEYFTTSTAVSILVARNRGDHGLTRGSFRVGDGSQHELDLNSQESYLVRDSWGIALL